MLAYVGLVFNIQFVPHLEVLFKVMAKFRSTYLQGSYVIRLVNLRSKLNILIVAYGGYSVYYVQDYYL